MRARFYSSRGLVVAIAVSASVSWLSAASQLQPNLGHGDFIRTANQAGMMAVAAAKLADKQSSDQAVKTFARRMADDHTKTLNQLAALSKSRRIVHPKYEDAKKFPVDLAKLRGPAFDTAFIALMVMGHEGTVALFEAESRDGKDREVKSWATGKLPALKAHLKAAQALQSRSGR